MSSLTHPSQAAQALSSHLKGGGPQPEGGPEGQGNSSSEEPSSASLPLRITRAWLTWPKKRGQPGPVVGEPIYTGWAVSQAFPDGERDVTGC